ncbi:MBL fold metallo-hydrolase [Ferruginibacter sp. SUN002]|uniref:MBL fold metallo-hydrolase n=1 Tax=Ferruginibacter sp. SUN002 TaxID=2937789 RepID=UPI003D364773
MKIIPLSEGAFTVDRTKQFIPFNKEKDDLQKRPVGSLLVEVQPFCVVTSKDIIVIDAGLGFTQDGVLQIHKNLMDHGIGALEVTKVLLSHLHKDHISGMTIKDEQLNQYFFSFPNATYYANKNELKEALEKGEPTYVVDKIKLLEASDKVHLMEDEETIDGYIDFKVTGGHSKCHGVFWIKEDNEIVFFGGDVAPQLQQMKNKFIAKYDYDGRKCMELRQQWWQQGQEEGWSFLFYHDIKTPVFKK